MGTVAVNSPKTPVTEGSSGVAMATVPNVCKMPGPPAPFVPTPLPNIGKSDESPKDYSKKVKFDGKTVAIKGASFKSKGDVASKGTGGGLVSMNTEGETKFIGPGSMDVTVEGKNVQLLSDPMMNNCGASGSPPNAATMLGVLQAPNMVIAVEAGPCPLCGKDHGALEETEQTKADAGGLASNFKAAWTAADLKAKAAVPPGKAMSANTMLGVVHCRCGKKYADQSAMTTVELCTAASAAGLKHPSGIKVSYADGRAPLDSAYEATLAGVKAGIAKHLGDSPVLAKTWEKAEARAKFSDANRSGPAAYPPGTCAAQKALLLLMDEGGLAAAMTEQWFSSGGSKTQAPIEFIDNRTGKREVKVEKFKPGDTVPPCKTCELIVPLLLCPGEKVKCH
jgi:hypothetical protein